MLCIFNKKKLIQQAKQEALETFSKKQQEHEKSKMLASFTELEMKIGKLVIVVSNEIDNVIVGAAKSIEKITQAQTPMLIVEDIITKKEIMPFGKIFDYSEQKFNALNKLDPNERIAIMYNCYGYHKVDKTSSQKTIPEDPIIWASKIEIAVNDWKKDNPLAWKEMASN